MSVKKYSVEKKIDPSSGKLYFGDQKDAKKDVIYLGRLGELGKNIDVLYDISHERVVAITGKRGSGKSYTLGVFVESLCAQEPESLISNIQDKRGVLLLDTLDIYWPTKIPLTADGTEIVRNQYSLLKKKGWGLKPEKLNVGIWVPAGFKRASMPDDFKEFYLNLSDFDASDWADLLNLDMIQDKMGQLITEAFTKVTSEGYKLISGRIPPKSDYKIDDLIKCIEENYDIQSDYHRETIRGLTQQLKFYNGFQLFKGQGTKIKDFIKSGKLTILLINSLPLDLRRVIASVLIKTILRNRAESSFNMKLLAIDNSLSPSQKDKIQKELEHSIPRTWIIIDEAQNIIPSEKKTAATDNFVTLIREGRNFGISVALTSQQPSALDQRVMAQVDTVIAHKLALQKDIDDFLKNLKTRLPDSIKFGRTQYSIVDLLRDIGLGQALVSNTESDRCFILDVRPRVSVHGGFEL